LAFENPEDLADDGYDDGTVGVWRDVSEAVARWPLLEMAREKKLGTMQQWRSQESLLLGVGLRVSGVPVAIF